jgi:hypothetical protein
VRDERRHVTFSSAARVSAMLVDQPEIASRISCGQMTL